MSSLVDRWSQSMMNNYGTPQIALVRGAGAVLTDENGKEYVDFLGGIAVNALGHAHPAVVQAVTQQISALGHVSNLYLAEPCIALAELLLALAGRSGRRARAAAPRGRRRARRHRGWRRARAGRSAG